ncbi:E3 ubiquitin-protein ligase Topors-like isoform X2 [Sinocyclocheilus anshuiensis]|uniref:E3 ubiquitin-protein ligase Topors-like isoform X2 n=1 Tax=Sinocyclocheilus anshuiensis TaxID=1608454 RepID=UPI0007B7E69F|nr:PREDICTED: E3 ubiquitin-protein ligase Topors-like isoform X2 [Sinocyclocheilus anshuiensis]
MASPQMKERPSGAVLNTISKGASPESKCPICLDHFKNISYLDVCLHKFCFCCIREWSKNKAECPLCKQPFNSIYHTIKSEDNYQRFDLRPTENGSFGNMAGQRFRYRTTLTGERRLAPRRTSSPPDHGVLFEDLRGSVPQRHNRDLHSMLRRLAEERQRRESEGRSLRSLHEQQAVKFRRALYRRGVRVQNVQDGGRSRETSAEFFRRNPACLHRLVPWVRRELTVLYGTHGSLVNIVQHIIMTLITRHNLDEQAVLHELRPFLLTHTEHFLHEFLSFARSPFNMEAYDQRAVYDLPRPSGESSHSETSVIAISEDESDSLVSGSQDYATPSVTLSQAPWDDETPGPSYSSEPSQVLPFHVRDSDSDSSVGEAVVSVATVPRQDRPGNPGTVAVEEEHSSGSDEDCMIIGHVKPVSERTPELVLLSSDSEQNAEPQSPRAPQHIRFTSESDLSPADAQRRPTRCSRSPENTSTRSRKDKCGKRHHERELSGSRERSSCSNRTHSSSRGRKHPLSKESKHKRRREKESSRHTSSYWHSYSHYSQSDSSRRCYTETCSSYTSYYRSVHRFRSRSHGRRRSRDRQDRSHSSSRSRIKPSFSDRQDRSHSKSRSRINSSNSQDRSRSKSNSRINSSNRQDRNHSRSNYRINSSKRQDRSRSRINSRINSSNRQDRNHSKSQSRINSSNHQDRSHSRSNSRINSSNRQDRSRSKSNSRINSSNHQDRNHSRSNSRINSSNHQDRSRSKSNSRINSSNHQDRNHSRSNSRINSSNHQDRSRSKSNSRINSSNHQDRSHSRSNSRINSNSHQTSHHDEHGRKKKYKTKHHEEPTRKSSSQLFTDSVEDGAKKKIKKHKKFKRKSRSPSIDDRSEDHGRKHHKKKKKHKRKSRRHSSEERVGKNSPVLITIPSDSDAADPSEPSARNISAADSTVTIASSATETQPLDVEQESAAGTECSSVGDAGNRPQTL